MTMLPQQPEMGRDDELRPEYRDLFRKTVFCRFFQYNACSKGDKCKFAHYPEECQAKPDLTKTALCRLWKRGLCQRRSDECPFAHGHQELRRPRPPPGDGIDATKELRRSRPPPGEGIDTSKELYPLRPNASPQEFLFQQRPEIDAQELYPSRPKTSPQELLYQQRPEMDAQELYLPRMEMGMGRTDVRSLAPPPMPMRNATPMPTPPWDEGIHTPMPEYIPSPKWFYANPPKGTGDSLAGIANAVDPYGVCCNGEARGQASTDLVNAIAKLLEQTTLQQRVSVEGGIGEAMVVQRPTSDLQAEELALGGWRSTRGRPDGARMVFTPNALDPREAAFYMQ